MKRHCAAIGRFGTRVTLCCRGAEAGVREERGAVLALVVVMMVSFLFVVAFVIEVGNWLEHRRHLQLLRARAQEKRRCGKISV